MKLVPIYAAGKEASFCQLVPVSTVVRGSLVLKTGMVAPDVTHNLFDLCHSKELEEIGLVAPSDTIRPSAKLIGACFYLATGELYYVGFESAHFIAESMDPFHTQDPVRKLKVNNAVSIKTLGGTQGKLSFELTGELETVTKEISVSGTASFVDGQGKELRAQLVGYDFEAYSDNPERNLM
jgi:hypothetical protein